MFRANFRFFSASDLSASHTTSTIAICTPHSLLEWRELGDHRGMYGVQIRVFFLVPDFAFIGVLWTSFLFIDLRSENRNFF